MFVKRIWGFSFILKAPLYFLVDSMIRPAMINSWVVANGASFIARISFRSLPI